VLRHNDLFILTVTLHAPLPIWKAPRRFCVFSRLRTQEECSEFVSRYRNLSEKPVYSEYVLNLADLSVFILKKTDGRNQLFYRSHPWNGIWQDRTVKRRKRCSRRPIRQTQQKKINLASCSFRSSCWNCIIHGINEDVLDRGIVQALSTAYEYRFIIRSPLFFFKKSIW
jgi:hypothetical protein